MAVAPSLLTGVLMLSVIPVSVSAIGLERVNMEGGIVSSACAIESASRDQTINMQNLSIEQIALKGHGLTRAFTLRLVNCGLQDSDIANPGQQHFQMIFDGLADGNDFGVTGEAKGVALRLTDLFGKNVFPGVPVSLNKSLTKDLRLNYSVQLVANHQALHAGAYRSAISFKLNYY